MFREPYGYPEWKAKGLPIEISSAEPTLPIKRPQKYGALTDWGIMWTLLGIFFGGMALNLTPCVYPLIPITVSYFGGRTLRKKGALLIHGSCYIGGLALTNSILGVAAALTGSLMGAMLQNPFVLGSVAVILLAFAASLFGFWELRMPYRLTQAASKSYAGYFGSLFMGMTLGVVAAPCIGPFVLGLLTWVAGMGSPWLGLLIFFTLSLGLGLPLFFLAVFSGQIEKLPRSGEWMLWVRKLMGWVLIGMAVYFIRPVLTKIAGDIVLAGVALGAGLHLGWIDGTRAAFRAFNWLKTVAGIAGLVTATYFIGSLSMIGSGVNWQRYTDQLIADAVKHHKPVIIDFSAAWCASCRELDDVTFHHPDVVHMSKKDVVMVKVDLTRKRNPVNERLLKQFEIKGVPTVVFLDPSGKERRDLRLVDFLPPDKFLIRMAEIKKHQHQHRNLNSTKSEPKIFATKSTKFTIIKINS